MSENNPGTADELLRLLEAAGLGRRQREAWVTRPSARLSGLVPGGAIADPATAARARLAVARLIASLPPPVPDQVVVVGARIVDGDGYLVELDFAWDGGTSRRRLDARPYLWGPGFERIRNHRSEFARFNIRAGALCWPGGAFLAPGLLYGESWPAVADGENLP